MEPVSIERWIDLDSADFKRLENHGYIRQQTLRAIELGVIVVDKAGYMWFKEQPIHAELDGQTVGLRLAAKAVN
jgi:hypothetical protein